jgi:multidrug resistance efflux pump
MRAPIEAGAAQARAHLEMIGLDVQALRDDIAAAEASLNDRRAKADYADSYYHRLEPLLAGNFTSADRVQKAKTDAESARSLVREAEASVQRTRNKLGEFEGRNTRVEKAEAALRDFELKVSYCKIYSPCDGHVTNLQIAPGSYAAAGSEFFDRGFLGLVRSCEFSRDRSAMDTGRPTSEGLPHVPARKTRSRYRARHSEGCVSIGNGFQRHSGR